MYSNNNSPILIYDTVAFNVYVYDAIWTDGREAKTNGGDYSDR